MLLYSVELTHFGTPMEDTENGRAEGLGLYIGLAAILSCVWRAFLVARAAKTQKGCS